MRRRLSRKPCHGCGETKGHSVDEVCIDCQRLLTEAREARAASQELPPGRAFFKHALKGLHWNPSYSHDGGGAIRKAMALLIAAVGEEVLGLPHYVVKSMVLQPEGHHRNYQSGANEVVRMSIEARDAFVALDVAVQAGQEASYAVGHRDGADLLQGLRENRVGLEEFDKRRGTTR